MSDIDGKNYVAKQETSTLILEKMSNLVNSETLGFIKSKLDSGVSVNLTRFNTVKSGKDVTSVTISGCGFVELTDATYCAVNVDSSGSTGTDYVFGVSSII